MLIIEFVRRNVLGFYLIGGSTLMIALLITYRARQLQRKAPFGAERAQAGFLANQMATVAIIAIIVLAIVTTILLKPYAITR